jgi:hypothetical protein
MEQYNGLMLIRYYNFKFGNYAILKSNSTNNANYNIINSFLS